MYIIDNSFFSGLARQVALCVCCHGRPAGDEKMVLEDHTIILKYVPQYCVSMHSCFFYCACPMFAGFVISSGRIIGCFYT